LFAMLKTDMRWRGLTLGLAVTLLLLITAPLVSQTTVRGKIGTTLTVTETGNWRSIQKGIEYRRIALERSEPSYTLELKLLRFDQKSIVARILYSGEIQLKGATAKTFADTSGAIAAINASYFDEKGRPLAYLKTAEKEINRTVSKHALYTGVFGVRDGTPFVMHRDEFQPAQVSQALQCGPLLLSGGAPVETMAGLGRYARRAVIGIDKNRRLMIGVTDAVAGGLSFAELQELFGGSRWQIDTSDLLNLDGGGSAQLYVKSGKFEEYVTGTSDVPVAIGFFARTN
jgi:exopolysaccharide biosynthesis protein